MIQQVSITSVGFPFCKLDNGLVLIISLNHSDCFYQLGSSNDSRRAIVSYKYGQQSRLQLWGQSWDSNEASVLLPHGPVCTGYVGESVELRCLVKQAFSR